VAVEVALVGEAGRRRRRGDRLAGLDQAPGGADAMGDLQRVGWEAGVRAKQPDEAELAYAGDRGELIEADDEFPEMGVLAPPSIGGTAVVLALEVSDAEAVFAQAVAAGAQVRQPLQDAFWGDRHGQLDDPFGHRWNVAQHLRDVPHDEVVAAAARAFG
jgi:uncharacterized glyoxalase superfamily protein PhnB